jgi:3-deoxy-D-manno-octulosonic-acid transferase
MPIVWLLGQRFSAGIWQRYGFYPLAQVRDLGGARPVWIHASSVGEVRSVATLIHELKTHHPRRRILLSTFTFTGNEIAKKIAGVEAVIFLPMDFLWTVRRALTHWNPSLMVFVETEIWPNLLGECFRRGIPTVMLSGRLSVNSYPRYEKFRSFFREVLGRFAAIGMQTGEDAERIIQLGADESRVSVVGSLKLSAAKPQPSRFASLPRFGKILLIAGSTHAGEERILLSAFAALRPKFPKLTMVLAPRHPQRFDEVEELLRHSGFGYCRRSRTADDQLFAQDILLLDTMGELGEFFACGDIAFVGGSLVDVGGHNILEPARSGKVIVFGPYMANVKAVAEEFKTKGAAFEVADGHALCATLANLLAHEEKRIAMGRQALSASVNGDVAVRNNYALAARYLSDTLGATAHVS